jgi:cytochrome oxidase Cu insertion factor (SCO1/SenC/PrrC family)
MTQASPIRSNSPHSNSGNPNAAIKNRKAAIAMMVVFLAPVLIAYILLNTGIYQSFGTSNRGVLLDPPMNITELQWSDDQQTPISTKVLSANWWLVYHMPETCTEVCEQRLLQLRQTVQTLGPEAHRVKPLVVIEPTSDLNTLKVWRDQLSHIKKEYLIAQSAQATNPDKQGSSEAFFKGSQPKLADGGLYIVDPMGFAMLYYAPVTGAEDAISQAKSLIKDLKYLLKVSRIG